MFYEKKMKNIKLLYNYNNMNNKQFENQHKLAMMILNRSWTTTNKDPRNFIMKKYINSPLKKEIIFYRKRNIDQLNIDINDFMRYKKKSHLIAI